MMKRGIVLAGVLLLGFSATAVQRAGVSKPVVEITLGPAGRPAKPAWEWSDEERIRVRFDPSSVRQRAQSSPRLQAQSVGETRIAQEHIIDGSRHPALFLPAELLDVLLQGLHTEASIRGHARVALGPEIRAMGYAETDFWNTLERLSTRYRTLLSRPSAVAIQRVKTVDGGIVSFPADVDRCVARHTLLQAARASFGAEAFQRFLYTAVAPQVQRAVTTQQADPAQEMLFIARGCQR